jgi:hypothetical protein
MGSILSKEDIFYFDIISVEEARKCTVSKVDVDIIDFVEVFKVKYSNDHERVELEQNKALSNISTELLTIKKVLVYLGSNIVGLDVSDDSFESLYEKHVIIGIEDIDGYCDMMATKLMKDLEEHEVTIIKEGAVLSELDILSWYVNAQYQYQYSEKMKDNRWPLTLSDIYSMMCDFLRKFGVLLKIKNIYLAFFNYVLGRKELTTEEKKNINIFFLQYEIVVFFDLFIYYIYYKDHFVWQSYCEDMKKEGSAIRLVEYKKKSMEYWYGECRDELDLFFPNKISLILKLDHLYYGLLAPLTIKYHRVGRSRLNRDMCSGAGSTLFVDVKSDKSKCIFYFDSSIVDLAYVADISVSLNYLLVKSSSYLGPLVNKYNVKS